MSGDGSPRGLASLGAIAQGAILPRHVARVVVRRGGLSLRFGVRPLAVAAALAVAALAALVASVSLGELALSPLDVLGGDSTARFVAPHIARRLARPASAQSLLVVARQPGHGERLRARREVRVDDQVGVAQAGDSRRLAFVGGPSYVDDAAGRPNVTVDGARALS